MIWEIPKLWDNSRCFIFGGGASAVFELGVPEDVIIDVVTGKRSVAAYKPYLEPLMDKRVIGINNAYQLGIFFDVLFFGDCHWYLTHRSKLIKWPGLKISGCKNFANRPTPKCEGIKYLPRSSKRDGISTSRRHICWNQNSGAAAISIAYLMGARQIILIGFDMQATKLSNGMQITHWHGSHLPPGQKPKRLPPFARHIKCFGHIAQDAKELGVEILNASPQSAIKQFEKVKLRDVLKKET